MFKKQIKLTAVIGFIGSLYASTEDLQPPTKRTAPNIHDSAKFSNQANQTQSKTSQIEAESLRIKSIETIKGMLKAKSQTPQRKFELLLRLGELYTERHDYLRGVELEKYEAEWDRWNASKDKRGSGPRPDYSQSKQNLQTALNIFNSLIKSYPNHERADAVLYALGSAYAKNDDPTAEKMFKMLLQRYPKSDFTPEAILALGDFYFDKHKIAEAIKNYQLMGRYRDHEAFPYSVYKLAWSYYNVKATNASDQSANNLKAANSFKYVIRLVDKRSTQSQINLRDEALNDLVIVLADIGDIDGAWEYFSGLGEKDKFFNLLERMGWLYMENGELEKSASVYERLMASAPDHKSRLKIYGRLFELYDQMRQYSKMLSLAEAMNTEISRFPRNQTDKKNEWNKLLSGNIHRYGATYHSQAQKLKNNQLYVVARGFYDFYLAKFKANSEALEIKNNLAELEFQTENFEKSSRLFAEVLKESKDSKVKKSSAEGMIDSAVEFVKKSNIKPVGNLAKLPRPLQIPREKQFLRQQIATYLSFYPAEKDVPTLKHMSAYVLFEYGHYEPAMKDFQSLIAQHPNSAEAKLATRATLGYYTESKNWDAALTFHEFIQKYRGFGDKELSELIIAANKTAIFSKALDLEKASKFSEAAAFFLTYKNKYPKDQNTENAFHNGINNFFKANDNAQALKYGEEFIGIYPQSTLRKDLIARMADTYEKISELDSAAAHYEKFSREYSSDNRARTALFNSAMINKALGYHQRSISQMSEYLRRYPNSDNSKALRINIAEQYEQRGENQQAIDAYSSLIASLPQAEKYDYQAKIIDLRSKTGDPLQVMNDVQRIAAELKSNKNITAYRSRNIISKHLFANMQKKHQNFINKKIIDSNKLEADIKSMQTQLMSLVNDYQEIIKVGSSEYMSASLYQIGQLHEHFSTEIARAPEPVELNESQLEHFRAEISNAAKPLRDQANQYYVAAFERAKEFDGFTEWSRITADKMSAISASSFTPKFDMSLNYDYIAHSFNSSTIGGALAH